MKYSIFAGIYFLALSLSAAIDPRSTDIKPDNTAVNQRDRDPKAVTASQQSSGEMDMYLVSRIRKDIMADKELSTYAKNVKIIALDGQVTVKGPVRSRDEAQIILKFARAAAGVPNVINELSVVPEEK